MPVGKVKVGKHPRNIVNGKSLYVFIVFYISNVIPLKKGLVREIVIRIKSYDTNEYKTQSYRNFITSNLMHVLVLRGNAGKAGLFNEF
jgi:hypothetical protein